MRSRFSVMNETPGCSMWTHRGERCDSWPAQPRFPLLLFMAGVSIFASFAEADPGLNPLRISLCHSSGKSLQIMNLIQPQGGEDHVRR